MSWTIAFWGLVGGSILWWLHGIFGSVEAPALSSSTDDGEEETDNFYGYPHAARCAEAAIEGDCDTELSLPYQDDFMFDEGGIC